MPSPEPFATWLENETLHTFVLEHRSTFQSLPFVLIAWLDSTNEVADMRWVLDRTGVQPMPFVSLDPVVVSGAEFVRLCEDPRILFGFDEVWVSRRMPTATPPQAINVAGPTRLDEGLPEGLVEWMTAADIDAGFGDGIGLNVVIRDPALRAELGLATGLYS